MHQRKHKQLHIVSSVDILLTLVLFYNIIQWGYYDSLASRILGIFGSLVVLNNWMTGRSSYDFYSTPFFFIDIVVAFCYSSLPSALHNSGTDWGYDPSFWLYIGIVEFSYIIWDILITRATPSDKAKKSLTVWAYLSILSTALALSSFLVQRFNPFSTLAGQIMGWVTMAYVGGMTIVWNYQRYIISKRAKTDFIE